MAGSEAKPIPPSFEKISHLAELLIVIFYAKAYRAATDCIALTARFKQEKPDLWLEDWGGGPNPRLRRARAAMQTAGESL